MRHALPRPKPRRLATLSLFLLALAAAPAIRAAEHESSHPAGYVDGSAFAELAGEGADVVEVNLGGSILRVLSRADTENEGFGEFLRNLQSITAYIVGLDHDAQRTEKATRMVREMEQKLEHQGWERLATVRRKEARINVYVRNNDRLIDGLVVLAVDRDEGRVVFANIAGTIDMARLGELSEKLDVPGLDALGDAAHGASKGKGATPKEKEKAKEKEKEKDD